MKKLTALLICLTTLILPRLSSPTAAQSPPASTAPYIYYYSDLLNAFVIERADGSDSRTIGDGLIPEDTNTIAGPGWSPSGEWFAWTAGNTFGGSSGFTLYVDGQRRLEFLDHFIDAHLDWSPIDDLLMFTGVVDDLTNCNEEIECTATMQFGMIDPNTQHMIMSFETPQRVTITDEGRGYFYNSAAPSITWLADGEFGIVQHVVILNPNELPVTDYEVHFQIFSTDGDNLERIYRNGNQLLSGGISPTGDVLVQLDGNDRYAIDNLLTGEQREFHFDDGGLTVDIHWSPVGDMALISTRLAHCTGFTGCGYELWMMSLDTLSPELVTDEFYDTYNHTFPSWSADGRFFVYATNDEVMSVYDLDHGLTNKLDFAGEIRRWQWLDSTQLLIGSSKSHAYFVHEYDIQTNNIINEIQHDNYVVTYSGRFSPDRNSFAYLSEGLAIVDVDTGQSRSFRPDGRSYWSNPGGEVIWHESGDWIVRAEEALISSGGGGMRWTGVVKADSSIHRDLGHCWPSSLCIDWLPDRVNPNNLSTGQDSSVLPEPYDVIHRGKWSFFISWSPDGHRIVAGHDFYREDNETVIYVVETHETIPSIEVIEMGQTIHWEQKSNGEYLPVGDLPIEAFVFNDGPLATSPDGTMDVAYTDTPFSLAVYEVSTGNLIFDLYNYGIATASFSPDGNILAVSGAFGRTQLYDTTTWEILTTLNTNATALAFSPDGQTLAVASSWDIQLWNVETLLQNATEPNED